MKSITSIVRDYWNRNGFAILVILSICILFMYGLYNKIVGKKGTYNRNIIEYENNKKKQFISKGEKSCVLALREIFGDRYIFKKERPDFLKNPVTKKYNLELDAYNEELKLAVEINGKQHYEYTPFFHRNKEAFQNQQYRDELKRRMCKDVNVELIEISYKIKSEDIKDYLQKILEEKGYDKFFYHKNLKDDNE